MKIGQLTFHASHNYGSVLQAYALQKVLQNLGHESEFINLRPQSQYNAYRIIKKSDHGIHLLYKMLIYPMLRKRFNHYERFINRVLKLSAKEYKTTNELREQKFDYDAYVCGGDQIWNPACQDFETAYYLQFLLENNKSLKISYSPSLGKHEFSAEIKDKISGWLQTFDHISIREKQGAELIEALTPKQVNVVCDPVLLLSKDEWSKMAVQPKTKKPYILAYFLENNHGSRKLIDELRKATGYEVVVLTEYIRDIVKPYHKAYSASPEEFVGLFMNASLVYTNSFHGTVFSTVFERPFITAIAADQKNALNNNDSRKINYLTMIGLDNRLYQKGLIEHNTLTDIDFTNARMCIEQIKQSSMNYLIKSLENE